eukprot:TRINITY_DN14150_c0_g1_i1.p1 TRINITY_DN14150_c0_g1~~TRINITY_DN14150_c0_g1_i1.p1  ORF type:complete len:616 (+),score=67.59 TRINITY_DN14150_c0_g1_i1:134-1981(+)
MASSHKTKRFCCFGAKGRCCSMPIFVDLVTENAYFRTINVLCFLILNLSLISFLWVKLGDLPWLPALENANTQNSSKLSVSRETGLDLSYSYDLPVRDASNSSGNGTVPASLSETSIAEISEILFGFFLTIGNSFTQHWAMAIFSMIASLLIVMADFFWLGSPFVLLAHPDHFREVFIADPVRVSIGFFMETLLLTIVVAFAVLLVLIPLRKSSLFFPEERKARYWALTKRLLQPGDHCIRENQPLLKENSAEMSIPIFTTLPDRRKWWRVLYGNIPSLLKLLKRKRAAIPAHAQYETTSDFYYPQRLLIAAAVSLWSTLVFAVYITFVFGVVVVILPLFDKLAGKHTIELISRIVVIVVPVVSSLVWLAGAINWIFLFRSYRKSIMLLRQGKSDIDRKKYPIWNASKYIGYQLCHSLFSFILFTAVALVVITIGVVAFFVKSFGDYLLRFLLTAVLGSFLLSTIRRLISAFFFSQDSGRLIDNFRWFTFFDYVDVVISTLTGIMVCISRLASAFLWMMLMFARLDVPLLTKQFEHFDSSYGSYVSMLLMDHQYNNPVAITFREILWEEARKEIRSSYTFLRARNRWHLALFLHKYPQLRGQRKHRLDISALGKN